MKSFSTLLLLLSVPTSVLSSQSVLIGGDSHALDLKVPGENTLTYCKDPAESGYIFNIDYVNLDPNPPVPGQNLTINAAGTSSKTIEKGAKLFIQVKLGFIVLLRQQLDFCDAIGNVDLSCPLEKGDRKIKKEVEIPGAIPSGKYTVHANAETAEGEPITCLEGSIIF